MCALGFRAATPVLRFTDVVTSALAIGFGHTTEPMFAVVFQGSSTVRLAVVSAVDGGHLVTTDQTIDGALGVEWSGWKQIFGNVPPAQLVAEHRRALAYLTERGAHVAAFGDVRGEIEAAGAAERRRIRSQPLRTAVVTLSRVFTRASRHRGRIEDQRGAADLPAARIAS
jgi:hypothetical protein